MESKETLADKVLQMTFSWDHLVGKITKRAAFDKLWSPHMIKLRHSMQQAQRFTLNSDFLRQAVRLASQQPHAILRMTEFAHTPFEKVWIEFDQDERVDIQAAQGTSATRAEHIGLGGFLIERSDHPKPDAWTATWFQGDTPPESRAYVGQSSYVFSAAGDLWSDVALKNGTIDEKKIWQPYWAHGWGYLGATAEAHNALAYGRLLSMGGTIPFSKIHKPLLTSGAISGDDFFEAAKANAFEGRGDLRFIITLLAMTNLCPIEYVYRPSTGRYTRRLRNLQYLDHRTVLIRAGKGRIEYVVDKAMSKEAMRKRRHAVRGHFRVYRRGKPNQLITWIAEHERGDASLGYMTHSYLVTAEAEKGQLGR